MVAYNAQVRAIIFFGGNASMFEHPLVRAKIFPSITPIVPESPRAINESLQNENYRYMELEHIFCYRTQSTEAIYGAE